MVADAPHRDAVEIVVEVPLDGQEAVEDPEVDALKAMEPVSLDRKSVV